VIVGHVQGSPIEESLLQLAPACAAMLTVAAVAARAGVDRLKRRVQRARMGRT
jgi:hypothetical protein